MNAMVCEDKSRDWSDVTASRGLPKNDSHHQRLGRGKEAFFLLQVSENA